MKTKKVLQKQELLMEQINKLRQIKLPPGWEIAKLDVMFKKPNSNVPIESSSVVYDARNGCFYAKTPRGYVYPKEEKEVRECLEVMSKANDIIKSHE